MKHERKINNTRIAMIIGFVIGVVFDIFLYRVIKQTQPDWTITVNGEDFFGFIWIPFALMALFGFNFLLHLYRKHNPLGYEVYGDEYSGLLYVKNRHLVNGLLAFSSPFIIIFGCAIIMEKWGGWQMIAVTVIVNIVLFVIAGFVDDAT